MYLQSTEKFQLKITQFFPEICNSSAVQYSPDLAVSLLCFIEIPNKQQNNCFQIWVKWNIIWVQPVWLHNILKWKYDKSYIGQFNDLNMS